MSSGFDRFLAGDGALATLIRQQPAFEPPERLFEQVMTALDAAGAGMSFEPPASLEAAVLAEAARLDAAQRPRRDALLDEIARGQDADSAMGAAVSDDTARWLSQQAQARKPTPSPSTKRRRQRWFGGLGVAVTAALAASVALKVWFDPGAPSLSVAYQKLAPPPVASAPAVPSTADEDRPQRSLERAERAAERPVTLAKRLPDAPAKPAAKIAREDFAEREQKQALGATAVAPEPLSAPAPRPSEDRAATHEEAITIQSVADAAPAESAPRVLRSQASAAPSNRADAPTPDFDVPIDIAPKALAERLQRHPPGRWQLHVSSQDEDTGLRLAASLTRHLQADGRPDTVDAIIERTQAPGRVQLTYQQFSPDAPRSPSVPPPPPSAGDR
jgi:hypothetical protein